MPRLGRSLALPDCTPFCLDAQRSPTHRRDRHGCPFRSLVVADSGARACWVAPAGSRPCQRTGGASRKAGGSRSRGCITESFAGYFIPELMVAVLDHFREPPHELQEMLSQQVLMLQVAAGAIGNVQLTDAIRERATGVYVGLGLDLNTTNFTFRWSVQAQGANLGGAPRPERS